MRLIPLKFTLIVLLAFISIASTTKPPPGTIICQTNNKLIEPFITYFPLPIYGLNSGKYTWTNPDDSLTIPLLRTGRIFLIEAEVDGEKGYLVFDTGASGIVLNKTYFRDHIGIKNQSSTGINGDIEVIDRVTIDKLEITGLQFDKLTAQMTNLGHIENKRGVKVLGLIGFSLLKDFEIIFDPGQNELQLFLVDKKGNRANPKNSTFQPDFRCTFELTNNVLFIRAILGGKNLRYCFDTGAEVNVIDKSLPKSVINCINITRRTTLSGAGSTSSEVLFGMMNGLQLGASTLNEMETIISNLDALSVAYDKKIDGMLGYSFLSRGKFCFNFDKNELGICFNKPKQNE